MKRTNDRLREDAITISANTEKGNIIQANASGGQANDKELMELGNTMRDKEYGRQDVTSPQHMEHSMMDRSGSVFLDNSYVDHNQQYGLDYMQRIETDPNEGVSADGANLVYSGISPAPIRTDSPVMQYIDVQSHFMNELNKASKDGPEVDIKISSHASKYEIPDLDRTLSNDIVATQPVEKVPVSPIAVGRLTNANIAETSRFGGVALQNSNSNSKGSLNFANEASKVRSMAFDPKD